MTKVWDGTMKWLAEEAPQDFVEWLREGSICIAELSPHLNARSIHADLLYRVQYEDQPYLLHIEFQKRSARNMPLRLFEYNLLATRKYKLPVYSVVIYLKKDRPVVEAPYILFLPWGRRIFHFDYHTIKLWEIPTESIFRSGLDGLLPLVPLTREGLRRESLERVIERLSPPGEEPKINQLALTYTLAELQYTEEEDFSWLKRRSRLELDKVRKGVYPKHMYTPGAFGRKLHVSVKTLQRWDRQGVLQAHRTASNRRYYTQEDLHKILPEEEHIRRRTVAYCRVSSMAQKPDLLNQRKHLAAFCQANALLVDEWISEIGGGLNFKRKRFLQLIDAIISGEVAMVVIAHKDRFARFGFSLLEHLCETHACRLLVMNTEELSPEQELVQDLMAITHCFSARLYGLRNDRKALEKALKDEHSTPDQDEPHA